MEKRNILAKVTRQMQHGPAEALQIIGAKEKNISYFIHSPQDEIECTIVCNYLKYDLVPAARKLLDLYTEQDPEYWVRIVALSYGDPLPEVKKFDRLKKDLKRVWNQRPRFEQKRILDKHGHK